MSWTDEDAERRPAGCACQWEAGDSPCPAHGEDDGATGGGSGDEIERLRARVVELEGAEADVCRAVRTEIDGWLSNNTHCDYDEFVWSLLDEAIARGVRGVLCQPRAKAEAVADWTDEDTEMLRTACHGCRGTSVMRVVVSGDPCAGDELVEDVPCIVCVGDDAVPGDGDIHGRAAAEIRRLQTRVAQLEREYECHPEGGVRGCDCWECLRVRIAALEAERAEVAKELREAVADIWAASSGDFNPVVADTKKKLSALATRLERKGE